jgi:type I restriction enzyme S subunit
MSTAVSEMATDRWRRVRLGDAIELAYGKNLPKPQRREGSVPVYGSNGVAGWHDEALVENSTVIVGRKGSAGAVHLVEGPCFPIDTTYYTRPRTGFEFDVRFLAYALRSLNLERLRTSTGVPGLSREDAYREFLPVPTLPEQRHVADVLSRAENIVRMRREAEQKAKEIIPALFLDMFGDPATNPKGWGNAPLSTVAEISYGIATKLDSTVTAETGRRILTISNVMVDGELDLSIERYSQAPNRQAASAEVKTGDLLFNWRNGSETHIGKTAIWEHPDSALHVSFLLRLRPDRAKATSLYLWALLNRLRSSGFFLSASRQQVNRKFNASELSALGIPVPPLELQKRFAVNAQELRRHSLVHDRATVTAIRAFQSLQAGVFSEGRAT